MNLHNVFVVVFGSAVAFVGGHSARQPRDIDFVFSGCSADDAEKVVRQWAGSVGLDASLPLDGHRLQAWERCVLPTPIETVGYHLCLVGSPTVAWDYYRSVSALIRAYHASPVTCADRIMTWARSEYRAIYRMDPTPLDGAWGEVLGAYCGDGIVAIRNARSHCTDAEWDAIVAGCGAFGQVLDAMTITAGLPAAFIAKYGEEASHGGLPLAMAYRADLDLWGFGQARHTFSSAEMAATLRG